MDFEFKEKPREIKSFKNFYLFEGLNVKVIQGTSGGNSYHPEAEFRPGIGIIIYQKFFNHSKDIQRHILFHELGHWFRSEFINLIDIMGYDEGEGFYNLFSAGNSEEGFAEAFAVYFTDHSELSKRYPTQYDFLNNKIGSKKSSIISWVNDEMRKI